jgi:SH3 domain-containing protein
MKKAVLTLWLAGAAVYTVDTLIVTRPPAPTDKPQVSAAPPEYASNQPDQPLRSWGPFLPGHGPEQYATAPALPKSETLQPAQDLVADSRQPTNPEFAELNGKTDASSEFSDADQTEWVTLILAAKVHTEPNISSPTLTFYQPGTKLQVESRSDGWLGIFNPTSQMRGWILEQYLSFAGPSPTQSASLSTADEGPKPIRKTSPKASKPKRSPTLSSPNDAVIAEWDPSTGESARHDRRRRLGLFGLFGRF